ncbi:S8 family peptidase [Xylanibacter caecicola]|uniref:S8 family peptidase n=1 Tax=Xylanibacter caecicola TaxID=2736294 RepID=UPI00258DBE8D|nr:S8 family peptidase [Xylanibacter caecicola]
MRKLFVCSLFFFAGTFVAFAQSRLDMVSRAQLRAGRLVQNNAFKDSSNARRFKEMKTRMGLSSTVSLGFVKLDDTSSFSRLEEEGATVLRTCGNIGIVSMPTADVERLSSLGYVRTMQLGRSVRPKMDIARTVSGVDAIHTGNDLTQAYTGKGVVTGVVDGGVDPNHINFMRADGTTRVGYLGHLRLNNAQTEMLESRYDEKTVLGFTTDDNSTFHGAHTLGIMAGGYRGNVTAAQRNENTVTISETANPYYGVAYDSDIAVSCGTLMDAFIAYGVNDILDYAQKKGEPAVVNLSLGSNVGAHDGKDMIHQYLDAEASMNNAIICVSAGNEGDIPIALNGTFSTDRQEIKTFIRPYVYTDLRYGQIVIYSNDATEFEVQAVIFNKSRGRVSFRMPVSTNTNGEPKYYVSSADYQQGSTDEVSSQFAKAFDGYVGIGSMTDENNGRYYAMIDYYTVDSDENADGNYILGFLVKGKEGQRIDCFCDGAFTAFDNYGYADWDNGSLNGSISDMACAKNVLVVGSYNTRDDYASLDGGLYSYQGSFPSGKMSSFTSFGTLIDGRNLPHVCAPGATIVSSSNTYYVENAENGVGNGQLQAKVDAGGRSNYWQQMIGTSMSTPFVAGSLALWLEADPMLTMTDIKDIISKTSLRDADVENTGDPVQWGAGKFDAYAGLKEVIRRKEATYINNPYAAESRLMISAKGSGMFEVFLGGAERLDVVMCDISGRIVAKQTANGDEMTFATGNVAPGVYIINVNGMYSKKITIR